MKRNTRTGFDIVDNPLDFIGWVIVGRVDLGKGYRLITVQRRDSHGNLIEKQILCPVPLDPVAVMYVVQNNEGKE